MKLNKISTIKRRRKCGFMARMATKSGRIVINRRRNKGIKQLAL